LAAVENIAKELSEKEPTYPWGPYYYALTAKDKEQWERASWMIELAFLRAPDSGAINYLRGQVQWHSKNFKAGVKSFELAVAKDSGLTPAQVLLGQVHFQDQDFTKALGYFNAALGNDSKNLAALHGYAECMVHEKKFDEAVSTLLKLADRTSDPLYLERVAEIQEKFIQDSQAFLKTQKKLEKLKRGVAGSRE
jgi:tetratricopeptide (TPR) repeat protein